ncbi:response regulator [Imperialibacter roseus]|uniref:Response regulator n=1 Tax=Imperialibacter roseus TaxID=1324217 RepID=A0ABZ0IIX1_9BACT|nr:response regulator [Imperialibacter roseus]WOK04984.1 response regulator [Imperialibacter roseus]|tara:strand:+ start:9152 stop:9520 length:369 start_codon:yes stop_codon:yes gene_type:complete
MKKILVAEDSSVIQNLTKKILTLQNFQITSVKNGEQVLQKLNEESFDLILMDINMPVMDGIECTKKVRNLSDEAKKNIPIVAITGNARNYTMEEFLANGINDFIPKPLNFDQLVEKVRKYTS